jgi:hypothetical protein
LARIPGHARIDGDSRKRRPLLERLLNGSIVFRTGDFQVRKFSLFTALVLSLVPASVLAGSAGWQRFVIPGTGTNVEIPVTIFSRDAELPDGGTGRRFYTDDRHADLTVQSVANPENDSPATFLAKKNPPSGILYKRVTPNFFVVSSIRGDRIWYNRCNRSNGYMNCVLINYPAAERRQWDHVVARISHTLAN